MSFLFLFQAAPSAPPEGFDLVPVVIEAAKGGQWSIFASLLIMLLVWLATKAPLVKDFIKGEARIWVAAVAGVLSAFAVSVFTSAGAGHVDWLKAVVEGLSMGLAAGGLWSIVGRKILGQPVDADGDGKLDELPASPPAKPDASKKSNASKK